MHHRSLIVWRATSAFLALIVLLLGFPLWRSAKPPLISASVTVEPDAWAIERARSLWQREGREPHAVVIERQANVIRFPNQTCVGLTLREYSVGANPIYCFDPRSRSVTYRNDDGE